MADQTVTLSPVEVAELKAQEAELGVPGTPQGIDRPDGQPSYTDQLAGAELLPGGPIVAGARHRLDKAREQGAHPDEIDRLQRELANVAGYELRDTKTVIAPPRVTDAAAAELVATDLLNLRPRGARRALLDGDLVAAYEDTLRVAIALRAVIERNRQAAGDAQDVPAPPAIRSGSVVVVEGAAWQWRDREWHPLLPTDELDAETRAAIEAHAGPLPR